MAHKKSYSFLLLALAALLCTARDAHACSCGPKPTVLEAYEGSSAVIIAKITSVQKAEGAGDAAGYKDIVSAKATVEKVYKGNLKVGEELTFAQGGGADCVWTFDEQSVGRESLFYLWSKEKKPKVWVAFGCGRSSGLQSANDDLLYLNKIDKVRGKTRISGTLWFNSESGPSEGGRRIRIVGANKTYEVKTDANGVYEIYDVPAGRYLIEPEVPSGWKVNGFYLHYAPSFAGGEEEKSPKRIPILLEDKKHAGLDLHFEIDNAIRGKVYDTSGKLMKGVCLKAVSPRADEKVGYHADCTEEDGAFEIDELPAGSYVLVINEEGKISSSEPFGTFYYPNVYEREKATVFTIGAGDFLENVDIHVPEMKETITVEGVFLYSDGRPVVDESVVFKAVGTQSNVEGDARAKTDGAGRFSIKILKGVKGKLHGEMYTYAGEYENCPKLEAVIKRMKSDASEIQTPAVEIRAQGNLYDVKLKYPFPSCKKAKEPSD